MGFYLWLSIEIENVRHIHACIYIVYLHVYMYIHVYVCNAYMHAYAHIMCVCMLCSMVFHHCDKVSEITIREKFCPSIWARSTKHSETTTSQNKPLIFHLFAMYFIAATKTNDHRGVSKCCHSQPLQTNVWQMPSSSSETDFIPIEYFW